MTQDTDGTAGADAPRASKRVPGALVLAGALLIGLAAGAAAGVAAGGPALASWRSAAADGRSGGGHGEDHEGGDSHGNGESKSSSALHTIENLVANPADTKGARFLMTTLALELDASSTADKLRSRDAEVRDALLYTLGSKTVEELSDIGRRAALKEELRAELNVLAKPGVVRRVYLTQFVIQ